jgi:cadmium resistance protein CadD (predicted permease)
MLSDTSKSVVGWVLTALGILAVFLKDILPGRIILIGIVCLILGIWLLVSKSDFKEDSTKGGWSHVPGDED